MAVFLFRVHKTKFWIRNEHGKYMSIRRNLQTRIIITRGGLYVYKDLNEYILSGLFSLNKKYKNKSPVGFE